MCWKNREGHAVSGRREALACSPKLFEHELHIVEKLLTTAWEEGGAHGFQVTDGEGAGRGVTS